MDRLTSLEFDAELHYEESSAGILVRIRLSHGNRSVELRARLDTGAADCIFDESYAELLGLTDSGVPEARSPEAISDRGWFVQGSRHEVTVQTLGLEWTAMVFLQARGNPGHAFVGRRGWLDRIRLGIVHYEQRLLLGHYGS